MTPEPISREELFYMGEQGENTLERYRRDAEDLITSQFGIEGGLADRPGENPLGLEDRAMLVCNATWRDLAASIAALVQRYVAHDLEWAALAVQTAMFRDANDPGPDYDFRQDLLGVVASIRERGRTP